MFMPRLARSCGASITLLMAFGLVAGGLPVLAQQPGESQTCGTPPCFTNVTDILQGERTLLPVDDLVLVYGEQNSDGSANMNLLWYPTTGVAPPNESGLGNSLIQKGLGPYEIFPTAAASASGVGRMFNLPRDVNVTAMQGMVTIRDSGPPINVKAFHVTETPVPGGMTMADFNGDGYDDFVLAQTDLGNDGKWHGYLQFATANDANDLSKGLNPGPYTAPDFPVGANALGTASITSADLEDDGIPEVIVAYPSGPSVVVNIYRFSRQDSTLYNDGSTTFDPNSKDTHDVTRTVVLAGNFTDATTTSRAYLYAGQSYIFGQLPPQGTIDETSTPSTTVQGNGFITVGYSADPLSTVGITSGNWWKQTYQSPDIALTLFVKALPGDGTAQPDAATTTIDVTLDPPTRLAQISDRISHIPASQGRGKNQPGDAQLSRPTKRQLLHRLAAAEYLFRRGHGRVAISRLDALERWVDARRGKAISVTLADAVDEDINFLLGCLPVQT